MTDAERDATIVALVVAASSLIWMYTGAFPMPVDTMSLPMRAAISGLIGVLSLYALMAVGLPPESIIQWVAGLFGQESKR